MSDQKDQPFYRPLYGGPEKNLPSGLVPDRTVPRGKQIQLKPLDPAIHTDDLCEASHHGEWTLHLGLPAGRSMAGPRSPSGKFAGNAGMQDRIFYGLRPTVGSPAAGQESFIDMHPGNSVIDISYIWFAPSMQRTRVATEEMYLMLEHAMT